MRKIMGSQEQVKFNRTWLGEDCNLYRRLLHKWWGGGLEMVECLQFVDDFWMWV